ncbi:MAG: tetratricopeptide repeat protein [Candidatus Cloacimonetes bacterium]|nr:tetratricopeptide repeat protein [Candidatus Cloacimonadota bacterium]
MSTIESIINRAKSIAKKNWLQAVNILEEQIELNPAESQLYLALAELLISRNQYRPALQHLLRALGHDPDNEEIIHLIGLCYMMLSEYRLALAHLKRIKNPSFDVLYNIGYAQAVSGNHRECLQTMEALLEELPDHPYIYYLIIEQHFSIGQIDEAIKYLNRALESLHEDQQIFMFAGLLYGAKQDWLKSYYYYNKAMSMGKTQNVEYSLRTAEAAMHVGLHERAITLLLDCEKRWPHISEIYSNLIKLYMHLDKMEEAADVARRADKNITRMSPNLKYYKSLLEQQLSDA